MKWKKLGQIFNPTLWNDGVQREWMYSHSQCVSTVIMEDRVRVYFSCRPKKGADGQATSNTTWLELSRSNLFEIIRVAQSPVMELGELGAFDEHSVYPSSVIVDGESIKFYYAGWYRCSSVPFNCSIGVAESFDGGDTFQRLGPGPILGPTLLEPFVISGPKIRKFNGKYFLYYLAGTSWHKNNNREEIIYKIRMATSKDGLTWEKLNKSIISDSIDLYECQAGPDVFYKDGKYHMYFVYREGFDFREQKGRGYKIGYAYSNDLFNWIRDDENVGIDYSDSGWDSDMHHYPHIFELDNKWYMLYNGNEFGKYGFGLAILDDE
jgi:predicted GH43/DUF377 family glycosyl hydrolase